MRTGFLTAAAAVIFLLSGCGTTDVTAAQRYRQPQAQSLSSRIHHATDTARDIAFHALTLLKTKYTWGGKTPASGLDCSGLVSHVYKEAAGLTIQGTAADLAEKGRAVRTRDLKEGDLVFFNTLGRPKSHVGIYVGEGKFVHALNKRYGVRIDDMSDAYYAQRYEGARSLLD